MLQDLTRLATSKSSMEQRLVLTSVMQAERAMPNEGLTRSSRCLLHQLAQLLVHHGMPKSITTRRLPAAGAAAASITLQHLPSVSTRLGTGGDLLQQLGAMGEPALGELVCGVVQPVPVGSF